MKSSIKKMEQMGRLSAFYNEEQDSPYYEPNFDSMDQLEIQTGRGPEGEKGYLKPVGLKKTDDQRRTERLHFAWPIACYSRNRMELVCHCSVSCRPLSAVPRLSLPCRSQQLEDEGD